MTSKERNSFPTFAPSILPHQPAPLVDKVSDTVTYEGYALLNTKETEKGWLIVRISVVGTVTRTEYPNSTMNFDQAWSERASLTYTR